MKNNTDIKLDDDLGIVEDLNEEQGAIQKEKAKVILIAALLIGVLGYMGYSAFKPKEKTEEKVKQSTVHIKKKKFDAPAVNIPKEQKVEIELPTSPLEKPKIEEVAPKVNKNSRGSIINFNSPVKEIKSNPNQVDVNFFNNTGENKQTSNAPVSSKKTPTIYRGGDYAIAGVSR